MAQERHLKKPAHRVLQRQLQLVSKNVHLVPLLRRRGSVVENSTGPEFLKLEEHHNRDLPQLKAASTPEEFATLTDNAVKK